MLETKADFTIKKKTIEGLEQKITLDTLENNVMDENCKVHVGGERLDVSGAATKNTGTYNINGVTHSYDEPQNYNIIFPADAKKGDKATVTIRGGIADGSTFTYTIVESDAERTYDSIIFDDYELYSKVLADLKNQKIELAGTVPYIINIDYPKLLTVKSLNLAGKNDSKVSNLEGMQNFVNLNELNLSGNNISSDNNTSKIDLLKTLSKITHLNLAGNALTDANVITDFKKIKNIDLSDNQISDLVPFNTWNEKMTTSNTTSKLERLNVSGNQITDVEPISKIKSIKYLEVAKNLISDVNKAFELEDLITLDISQNQIKDIDGLNSETLTDLRSLNMSGNKITDISKVKGLRLFQIIELKV